MAKQYFYRRYIRNPIPKTYKPQPRDDQILQRIDQYGRLDTYQLLALLQPFGLRNLRRRLQYLFHDDLVALPGAHLDDLGVRSALGLDLSLERS